MTRITFEEVSLRSRWKFRCADCGKRLVRTKKFRQTLNPFNKNPDGTIRSRADILARLRIEANEWQASDVRCRECES